MANDCTGQCLTAADIGVPEAGADKIAIAHPGCPAHGVFADPAAAPARLSKHLAMMLTQMRFHRHPKPGTAADQAFNSGLDTAIATVEEFLGYLGLPPDPFARKEGD